MMKNGDGKNIDEERVYEALKRMQMKPSKEFKEETFQMMQKEIGLARKDVKRKGKHIMKKSMIISLSGIAAAIAFVLLLNMNGFKEGVTPDRQPGENQTDVVQKPDMEKEEPNASTEQQTESNRPKTKEIVTYPEGMEEVNTYQLLDNPSLPFTTYIPQNFVVDPVTDSGDMMEVRMFSKLYPYNVLTVGFFEEGTSEEVAGQKIEQIANEFQNVEQMLMDGNEEFLKWAITAYAFHGEPSGVVALGKHEEQYFYIISKHTLESGDGWGWIEKLILDEWEWRNAGLPLNK